MKQAGLALACMMLAGCPGPSGPRSPLADLVKPDGTRLVADARPAVVAFWADWAPPCSSLLAELPSLAGRARVVAAFAGEYRPGVEARAGGLEFALAKDSMLSRLGVRVLPTVVVLDKSGRSAGRFEGYSPGVCSLAGSVIDTLLAVTRQP